MKTPTVKVFLWLLNTSILLFGQASLAQNTCADFFILEKSQTKYNPVARPSVEVAQEAAAFWAQQVELSRERRDHMTRTDDIEMMVKMSQIRATLNFSWAGFGSFYEYVKANMDRVGKYMRGEYKYELSKDLLGEIQWLWTRYLFFSLSLTPTGQEVIGQTLDLFEQNEYSQKGLHIQFMGIRPLRATYLFLTNKENPRKNINMYRHESLVASILLLVHELVHARDDLKLGLFKNVQDGSRQLLFLEHRAYLTQNKVAKELGNQFTGLDPLAPDLIVSVTMDEPMFHEKMLSDIYGISEETYRDYFLTHSWDVFPETP